ncbi:MAG: tetratricopeptide repeat protein [Myxococcaceae bacterium]|nr:tetratricopeptide repeat protein [Myxococcaceae bacterium]
MPRWSHRLVVSLTLACTLAEARADGTADPSPRRYESARAQAARAVAEGRFDDAAATLAGAIADFPEDFALRLELGYARLRSGQAREAEAAYRAALELNDSSYEARWGLADALAAQRRWDDASRAYEAMLALRPGAPEARRGLALVFAGQGRWAELRDETATLLAEREDAQLHSLHALARFWLRDFGGAQAHSERALALAPGDRAARLGLAWVAQRRGQRRAAREGFDGVLREAAATDAERASAQEGLDALGPASTVEGHAHGLLQSATDHPARATEWGVVAGLDAVLGDRWLVGARYRHLEALTRGNAASFSNDEGWGRVGLQGDGWSTAVYGAGVSFRPRNGATADWASSGWMVGGAARVTAWADFGASVTASVYPDGVVGQGEVGATLPLTGWLSVAVAARGQTSPGGLRLAGLGFVQLRGARWGLGAGGGYGAQLHPVELDTWALYGVNDEQRWRATLRGHLQVGAHVRLYASGDTEAWRSYASGAPFTDSLLFRAVIGVGVHFPGG